jgi:hypothetical protein
VLVAEAPGLPARMQEVALVPDERDSSGPEAATTATDDFRALLKAAAMRYSRPIQIIRRTTWDPAFTPSR